LLGERIAQAGAPRDRQEPALELGVGEGQGPAFEHLSDIRGARDRGAGGESVREVLRVTEVAPVGSFDRVLDPLLSPPRSEIDEGAQHTRCRQAALADRLLLRQRPRSMHPDT
jgi:hypothetical protein